MQFRIGILIGLAAGVCLASLVCRKRASRNPENERWQSRIDELQSFYNEEKAIDNLGNGNAKRNRL